MSYLETSEPCAADVLEDGADALHPGRYVIAGYGVNGIRGPVYDVSGSYASKGGGCDWGEGGGRVKVEDEDMDGNFDGWIIYPEARCSIYRL